MIGIYQYLFTNNELDIFNTALGKASCGIEISRSLVVVVTLFHEGSTWQYEQLNPVALDALKIFTLMLPNLSKKI